MILNILLSIIGGFISRDCGKDKPIFPYGLSQFAYALPYGLAPLLAGLPISALVSYAGAVLGKRVSHGQYVGSGKNKHPENQIDSIDPLVRFFFGVETDSNYWRNKFGLAVTGLICTLPLGILWAFQIDVLAGLLIALSGATKALAYMIGWAGYEHIDKRINPTLIGEVLTGVFGWGAVACLL